ncbi:TPA: IS110 family transposase, partial [Escherichia coli]
AICEAVTRPNMRFVQIKTEEQQAVLALHTERGILIRERIACANSLRATLAEFGITIAAGQSHLTRELPAILEDGENGLSPFVRTSIYRQSKHIRELEEQVKQVEEALASWYRTQEACQRMAKIPGVGMLTATYVVAAVGNARQFSTAKQFASWLGLTPKEHSSGGKQQLGGISKRGDGYFRYLLVHGARALTAWVNRNGAVEENSWLQGLLERKHYNVAVVAMAAKTARIMWSMLSHNTEYQPRQLA